jgi:hypothetical protein
VDFLVIQAILVLVVGLDLVVILASWALPVHPVTRGLMELTEPRAGLAFLAILAT